MTDWPVVVRALKKTDKRADFCSGNIELDRFFQRFAGQNQFRHHIGTSYVAVINECIAGFVTVSSGQIEADKAGTAIKKWLPAYPLPVLRISRLAVDRHFQKQGLGKLLLKTALTLALEMRERFGCVGVVVDAKADAIAFYEKLGFVTLEAVAGQLGDRPAPAMMFLALDTLQAALPDRA